MNNRFYLIFITILFFSCGKVHNKDNTYRLISNDSTKYWYLVEKNDKPLAKKTVWMFNKERDFYKYFYKSKDSLFLIGNDSDKLYSNKFTVKKDCIYLNSIPYKLVFLSEDSLYIKNIKSKVKLKRDLSPKYIDTTKPKQLKFPN